MGFFKQLVFVGRAYARNLGQRSILARKSTFFFEKRTHPRPYSIPFLSVLHQNKALHIFHIRGQRSIVERNVCLEYALVGYSKSQFKD